MAAGAGRLCTDLTTEVEVIVMEAGSITGFPLLNTVFFTEVEVIIMRAGSITTGFPLLCTDVSTQVEVIIMGACIITRFPLLNADIAAYVQSKIFCAEVREGDGGSAVIVAVANVCQLTRTVHLVSTPLYPRIHT